MGPRIILNNNLTCYSCVPALLVVMEVWGPCISGRGQVALPLPEGEEKWRRDQVEGRPIAKEERS